MNNILDFIERHKYGIIIAFFIHVVLFLYLQIETYKEVVVYEAWDYDYKGKESPDDIEMDPEEIMVNPEDIDKQNNEDEKISSFVSDANDQRERAFEEGKKYTTYEGDALENVKAFEKEVFENLASKRGKKQTNDATASAEENAGIETSSATNRVNPRGSEKAVAGKTMVTFTLDNRKPLNNNDWHVRNPGYTCGNVNGKVVVQITVDQGGKVVSTKYLAEKSQHADECMVRQAEKYAKLSRFNYDGNAPKTQQGIIEYLFVYRK